MKRKITISIIVVVCFLLQTTIFKTLSFGNISPNLLIIVTSSFGFMRGKKEGMLIGFICGLIIDIFFGSVLGLYAVVYMYIGYANGFFRTIFFPEDIKLPIMLIAVSDLLCNLITYTLLFVLRKKFAFDFYLFHIILPELVYTILVTIFLYFVILKVNQKLEQDEKRSANKVV